jgi:hypothetical protein
VRLDTMPLGDLDSLDSGLYAGLLLRFLTVGDRIPDEGVTAFSNYI